MPTAIHYPTSTASELRTRRVQFRLWLRRHRRVIGILSLPQLLNLSGHDISMSSAYRAAVAEGLRGVRRNCSRYDRFWSFINWDLPDAVLEKVWGVSRGNLRQRRVRRGIGPPTFCTNAKEGNRGYRRAISREKARARRYTGPRPK